ncbi:MAG: tRNA (adenosine(37)-N6)-dimethylallyltransferase MiaA [Lentisphaeria bacterium]
MSNHQLKPESSANRYPFCIAVLGPTCSGKSPVALQLAEDLKGEILSCDSMQIYQGMDIGTATPSKPDLARIPHHLINDLDIHERYDAYRFVEHARNILTNLADRKPGTPVILVGGTGLYAKALIYNFAMHPSDQAVYQQVMSDFASGEGEGTLRREILKNYPNTPKTILDNPRRLMRAVEIMRLGANPLRERSKSKKQELRPLPNFHQFVLLPPPDIFNHNMLMRTRQMLESGWIEETRELLSQDLLNTPTARQALGYSEIVMYLRGEIKDRRELERRIASKTRKYARRQRTWFRRQHPGSYLLPLRPTCTTGRVAAALKAQVQPYLSQ